VHPSLATVEQLIIREKQGNCVPIFIQLSADLITPCMAYLRIAKDSKYSFLLESVIAGENIARYSFVGAGTSSPVRLVWIYH
jgi:anthranilate synthase component 1